jgi:hypothetical protein
MSAIEHAAFWSDDALLHDAGWETVRALVRQVFAQFGWPEETVMAIRPVENHHFRNRT